MKNILLLLGLSVPMHIILILFSCLFHVQAQDANLFLVKECPPDSNFTSDSPYHANLNRLLSSLVANGTQSGYYNAKVGSEPDTVYGLVSCRGDLSVEDCRACLNTSIVQAARSCPKGRAAVIRYERCLLRYSNFSFFSLEDNSIRYLHNIKNVTQRDLAAYNKQLGILMRNLSQSASSRQTRFDSGSTNLTDFINIYGYAQCTRDLSPTSCLSCLDSMIKYIPDCCNGMQGARMCSPTCIIRYELYPFLEEYPPPPSPPPPALVNASPPDPRGDGESQSTTADPIVDGGSRSTNVVAIVSPTIVGVLLLAVCVYLIIRRERKSNANRKPDMIIYDRDDDIRGEDSLQYDFNTIRSATNDFSDGNKLGEGGFGAVYRGELLDGREIAVKRLSTNSGQGSQEFKNEVVLLHKLQHRNLVRLMGFCLAGEEKLLIYEYIPNTSLDKYIFVSTKKAELDWKRRYKIIGGIARGLLYLHEDSRLRIIHRDLKAGNILLDEEMNAKIADFGMAKLFGEDQTQGNTSRIAGTFGYMAPEYLHKGLFSVKSDVFSFGVLLLEIISGQKANGCHLSGGTTDLLDYAWKFWKEGNAQKLMDPILMDSYIANEVMRCIHIGLLCVQQSSEDRPTMSSVVLMLNSNSLTLASPLAPAFTLATRTGANNPTSEVEFNRSSSSSLLHSSDGISCTIPR